MCAWNTSFLSYNVNNRIFLPQFVERTIIWDEINFKCLINERKMIWIMYNVCLIKRESIKVGQSVCNLRRNRPKLWIEKYVRRREKLQGNAGGFATPREREREIPPFTILSFPCHLLPFFARATCVIFWDVTVNAVGIFHRGPGAKTSFRTSLEENGPRYFSKRFAKNRQTNTWTPSHITYDSFIYIRSWLAIIREEEKNNRKIDDKTECILSDSSRMN